MSVLVPNHSAGAGNPAVLSKADVTVCSPPSPKRWEGSPALQTETTMTSEKRVFFVGACVFVLAVVLPLALSKSLLQAAPAINIDVIRGTLNDKPLDSLTIDTVTDLFGRPTASDRFPELVGAQIYYHTLGLKFWFKTSKTESEKRLLLLDIHVSKTWDSSRSQFFLPFQGTLNPPATANWKSEQIMNELAPYKPTETLPDQYEREVLKRQRQVGISGGVVAMHVVTLELGNLKANFFHEAATRFLERITVVPTK
jgi:hypothetical protein